MRPKSYDEIYEEQMSKRMAEGKVIRMYKPSCGWQYVSNKARAINGAKRRDYVHEDVAVKAGVPLGPCGSHRGYDLGEAGIVEKPKPTPPKAAEPKAEAPAPKRGPGRPRKLDLDADGGDGNA